MSGDLIFASLSNINLPCSGESSKKRVKKAMDAIFMQPEALLAAGNTFLSSQYVYLHCALLIWANSIYGYSKYPALKEKRAEYLAVQGLYRTPRERRGDYELDVAGIYKQISKKDLALAFMPLFFITFYCLNLLNHAKDGKTPDSKELDYITMIGIPLFTKLSEYMLYNRYYDKRESKMLSELARDGSLSLGELKEEAVGKAIFPVALKTHMDEQLSSRSEAQDRELIHNIYKIIFLAFSDNAKNELHSKIFSSVLTNLFDRLSFNLKTFKKEEVKFDDYKYMVGEIINMLSEDLILKKSLQGILSNKDLNKKDFLPMIGDLRNKGFTPLRDSHYYKSRYTRDKPALIGSTEEVGEESEVSLGVRCK